MAEEHAQRNHRQHRAYDRRGNAEQRHGEGHGGSHGYRSGARGTSRGDYGDAPHRTHRFGERRGFTRDDEARNGARGERFRKPFHRDGEGASAGDGERRAHAPYRSRRNDGYQSHDRRGGAGRSDRFQRDRQGYQDRRDTPRYRRDDERGGGERNFQRGANHRFEHRDRQEDDRQSRDQRRDQSRERQFASSDRMDRRSEARPDFHREDRRDARRSENHRDEDRHRTDRRYDERRHEEHRQQRFDRPRRNSDGTMSFPSQNPYTARRPNEPVMPQGMEWSMLSSDERERLRGLSKEHAENIGLHILAAYALEESNPKAALEHAQWVAHQASRIDFARETLAFIAYRQGDFKLAAREFRTAYRMNGYTDYLPFIADSERGLGNMRKALEIALSDEAKQLKGESKAEMILVYAGILADLHKWDKAIDIVHKLGRTRGVTGGYRMRAVQAEQYFLEEAGRQAEALALDDVLDTLERQYADADEDADEEVVIDYDIERSPEAVLEALGMARESRSERHAHAAREEHAEGEADESAAQAAATADAESVADAADNEVADTPDTANDNAVDASDVQDANVADAHAADADENTDAANAEEKQ